MKNVLLFAICVSLAGVVYGTGPKGGDTRIDEHRNDQTERQNSMPTSYGISSEGNKQVGLLTRNRGDKDRPVPKAKVRRQRNTGKTVMSSSSDQIKVMLSRGDKDRPIPRNKNRHKVGNNREVVKR